MKEYSKLMSWQAARKLFVPGLACALLQGCGFVTAPLGQASVEVMSVGLRSADYGVERGGEAAAYVGETVASGSQWTFETLQDMGNYLVQRHAEAIRRQKAGTGE